MVELPEEVTAAARRFENATADAAQVCRGVGLWYAREGQPSSSAYTLLSSWLLQHLKVTALNVATGLLRNDYQLPTVPRPPRGLTAQQHGGGGQVSGEDHAIMYPTLGEALCAPVDYLDRHLDAFLVALERKRGALLDHHRACAEIQHNAGIQLCETCVRALHGLADTAGQLAAASRREDWNLRLACITLPDTVIEELHALKLSGVVIEQITRSMPLPRAIEQPRVIPITLHHLQQAANRLGICMQEWASANEDLPLKL